LAALAALAEETSRATLHTLVRTGRQRHSRRAQKARPGFPHTAVTKKTVSFRSFSKSSMDCPSTPAAPLFALTLLYASHTSRFGISNDLSSGPDLPTRLLPDHRLVARSDKPTDEPAPSLRSRYRSFPATTSRSASRCRDGTQRLTVSAARRSSSRHSSQ